MAEVISEEGYLDTTVHKILRRAGISRRTYYEIFKDKEDCFLIAYEEATEHMMGLIRDACSQADTPEQRIEDSMRAAFDFAEREPNVARMCIVEVMAAGPTARSRRAQTMEQVTRLIADALSERCETRSEALLRARVLAGGIHELLYDRLARGQVKNLSKLAGELAASHLAPPEAVHGG